MASPASIIPASIIKVRRAASLALAAPDISLVVYQPNWPPVLVSASSSHAPAGEVWIHARPSQFREELCRRPATQRLLIGPALGVADVDVRIEVVTAGRTTVDAGGVFTIDFEDGHSETGFVGPSTVAVPAAGLCSTDCDQRCPRRSPELAPTVTKPDHDLGTKVITWSYPTWHLLLSHTVRAVAFGSMLAMTVDELVQLTA